MKSGLCNYKQPRALLGPDALCKIHYTGVIAMSKRSNQQNTHFFTHTTTQKYLFYLKGLPLQLLLLLLRWCFRVSHRFIYVWRSIYVLNTISAHFLQSATATDREQFCGKHCVCVIYSSVYRIVAGMILHLKTCAQDCCAPEMWRGCRGGGVEIETPRDHMSTTSHLAHSHWQYQLP